MKYLIVAILIMGTAWAKTCRYTDGSPQLLRMSACGAQYCQASIMCDDELINTVCKATNGKCPQMAILCMGGEVKVTSAATFRADAVLENRKNLVAKLNATLPYTIDKDKIDASKLEAAIDMMAYLFNKINPQLEKEAMKQALQEVVENHGIKEGFLPVAAEAAMRAYHMGFSAVGDMITPAIAQLNPEMGKVFQQEVGSPVSYGSDYIMGFDMNQVPGMQSAMDKVFANSGANGPLAGIQTPGAGVFGLDDSMGAMFNPSGAPGMDAFGKIAFGDSGQRFGGITAQQLEMHESGYNPGLAVGPDNWDYIPGASTYNEGASAGASWAASTYRDSSKYDTHDMPGTMGFGAGYGDFYNSLSAEEQYEVASSIESIAGSVHGLIKSADDALGDAGKYSTIIGAGALAGKVGGKVLLRYVFGIGVISKGIEKAAGSAKDRAEKKIDAQNKSGIGGTTGRGTTGGGTTDGGTTDGGTTDGGTTTGENSDDDNKKSTSGNPDQTESSSVEPAGFKSPTKDDTYSPLILTNPDDENGGDSSGHTVTLPPKNSGDIDFDEEDENPSKIKLSPQELIDAKKIKDHGGHLTVPDNNQR